MCTTCRGLRLQHRNWLGQPENHFHHFHDSVHMLSEKWFFISEKQLWVDCALNEIVSEQNAQNRDHLIKGMILCAIACSPYKSPSIFT